MREASSHLLLAGDVGGTKTVVALFEARASGPRLVREAVFPSPEFKSLEAVVSRFLEEGPSVRIAAACFGVAGPVVDGRCVTTNLPWQVDEGGLAKAIPAPRVRLLNDLEAAAYGVLTLPPREVEPLQVGKARKGNMVLIAAGTGLGEAILVWDGARHRVIPSEGGHADFAPRNDLEMDLLRFLQKEFGHVSYERVLSGPGLHNIYRFLRDTGHAPEPPWLGDRLRSGDPSAVVSEVGLAGGHPLCVTALELFVSIYGAEAGNLALKALAVGGVYVGGGIAPKIRAKLVDGNFLAAFCDKGRYASLLGSIPLRLVLNPRAPLLGAAQVASELLPGR
ncbi:MAG: glucokinase [Candidatus Rokubacteria bacterium]|nr:glucokinase [Candidatus Rokubacteria bacterium]